MLGVEATRYGGGYPEGKHIYKTCMKRVNSMNYGETLYNLHQKYNRREIIVPVLLVP